jgi:hypothetical protein
MPSTLLASILRLNTRLFLNCVQDVTDAHGLQRPNGATNSLAFIACHLLDARHYMARYLGLDERNPVEAVLRGVDGIDEVELPPLVVIVDGWRTLAPTLEACVAGLTESELRAPSTQRFPIDQPTVLGGLGFLLQHDSYHIGQLALLRKYLGYPAMKYS